MKRAFVPWLFLCALAASTLGEEPESTSNQSRGLLNRVLHPFTSDPLPEYKDAHLRGLVLSVQLAAQPLRLSEVRQMEVKITLTDKAKLPVTLEFPDEQRFEIYLRNSEEKILTTWSENHAFADEPGRVMINPQEHIQYDETIATRELTPNKVFILEIFFPKYPELRVRQKFMTAP